jgi:iron complex outermembrane recepter protein
MHPVKLILSLYVLVSLFIPATARAQQSDAGSTTKGDNIDQQTKKSPTLDKQTTSQPANGPSQTTSLSSSKEETTTIGEVVVSADRVDIPLRENPAATTVVGAQKIENIPKGVGAEEALRLVPGVKVDNQANGERVHLSIRGQGLLTERGIRGIKVLLDGLPLNDPTGFAPDLFDVDWSNVQRIEVLRGPASALYGGGSAGGVINITTKDGGQDLVGSDALMTTGAYNFWKGQVGAGGTAKNVNYRLSASRNFGDGYRDHTQFDALNLYSKARWTPLPALQLTGIVAGTTFFNENAEGLNITWLRENRRQANPDANTFDEYQRTRRFTAGLVGQTLLSKVHDLSFRIYYRRTGWRESVPSSLQYRIFDTPGATAQYNLHFGNRSLMNHFSLGSDVDYQQIDDHRRPNLGAGVPGSDLLSKQSIEQVGIGVFALDRLELYHVFGILAGIRYDHISNKLDDKFRAEGVDLSGSKGFGKATARAGVSWTPYTHFGLYANWSQGFMPPATEELANNPDHMGGFNNYLVPATSMGEEVGIRGTVKEALQLSYDLAAFHLATDNDFGRYRITDRPLETFYQNAGSSQRYGIESTLGWYPIPSLAFDVAYTYSHFRYTNIKSLFGNFKDQVIPNTPTHQVNADAQYVLAQHWVFGLGADAISSWYVDQTNTTSAHGYVLLNLRLAYRWHTTDYRAELFAYGRNLLALRYIAFTEPDPDGNSFQPGPTREVFVGARVALGK